MMSDESHILQSMRLMAWERAKGELFGILQTFHSNSENEWKQYNELKDMILAFITDMEEEASIG